MTKFYYDAMGRASQTNRIVDGTPYTTTTTYDSLGRIGTIGYPDNTTITYEYNGPALSRVYEGTANYAQYTGYNALAQPGRVTFGNSVFTDYSYSNTGNADCSLPNFRLCKITTGYSTNPKYQDLKYGYDNVGNITAITDLTNANNNQTFNYQDDLDRLTSATGPYGTGGATATITFAYDQIGNMTCNSQVSACTGASPNYTYPASGATSVRPHAVTTAGTNSYAYDANGNMTGGAGRTIAYTSDNRPATITTATGTTTFVYDGSGGRVKKTAAGSTTIYIGKLYECKAGSCSKYIFASGDRIALKPVGTTGEIYYYHGDHLGSSSVMTDRNGAKVQDLAYFPYGQTRVSTGSININHRYTSQEMDDSTGLYFYNARYYDPLLGRFIQANTIVPNPADPEALNRYSYVRNNPLKYTDPSGHGWFKKARKRLNKAIKNTADAVRENERVQVAVGVGLQAFGGPMGAVAGTVLLTRSEAGRNILAGEIVVGTAAATFYCGGCGAAPVLTGALAGEAAGAYGAHRSGGDLLTGVAIGGISGAAGGAVGGEITSLIGGTAGSFAGTVSAGATGGFTQGVGYTLAYGGSMREAWRAGYQGATIGAAIGAVSWGLNQSFREYTTYGNNGQRLDPKDASIFPRYDNVFGRVEGSSCQSGNSICSSIGYHLPFGDSGSWAHDGMLNYLGASSDSATNYLTMPHAGLLTVGAALHEFPSAPLNIDQTK